MDFGRTLPLALASALALGGWAGCMSMCDCRARAENRGTAAAAAGTVAAASSGLPVPPGVANVARPGGVPGRLKVLDWAGFKSAVSYTFDDGQPSQIEHYAELQATGVRLTFFVNSAGAPSPADVVSTFSRAVRDGHEIGNHTAHHCHADADGTLYNAGADGHRSACPGASAGAELDDCTAFITRSLGAAHVWSTAWPFGDAGFAAAASARFFLNRGTTPGTVAPNDDTDPFNLPMWGPAENDTVDKFDVAVDGARAGGRWVIMLLHSLAPTTSPWYATVDVSTVTGSIAHAKSLGDVWIDTMANVGAYWRAQKLLSSVSPIITRGSQVWMWRLPEHFPPGKYLRVTVDGGTLTQRGRTLAWDSHGYYEVELDAGSLTLAP
jgi:peptidoglycan/xylan/chitin deacetylase (PgdA/CDA1 family)